MVTKKILLIYFFFARSEMPPASPEIAGAAPEGSNKVTTSSVPTDIDTDNNDLRVAAPLPSDESMQKVPPSLDSEISDEEDGTQGARTEVTEVSHEASNVPPAPTTSPPPSDQLQHSIKALIDFIAASEQQPLWAYEDITPKQLTIRSSQQLANFVRHVVAILNESLPHCHLEERLAQIALHLALSCSSRHYAGRSLQVLRCLHVSLSSRMLSELLSRLVETVAEQGEDMQGYVTELMLTLEAAVDALHSDFRPIEFVRELFKSTPNLNNKERKACVGGVLGGVTGGHYSPLHRLGYPHGGAAGVNAYPLIAPGAASHLRSTSFSISYARGKQISSPTPESRMLSDMRGRSSTDADARYRQQQQQALSNSSLSRSRSAQSLKMLADQSNDDKLAVLSQLFWIAVSLLESDYDYEFLLATRLLDKVLSRLPLDRPDALDKLEKLQHQLKWRCFPGVHALLLKGCTSPTLYEPAVTLLANLTRYTHLHVIDPSPSRAGFAMNVIALLPYMLHHYEEANDLCIQAAKNIAQVSQECTDEGRQLQNLATVMTLYSRRNFSKESFQWTKCVVKYLHDSFSAQAPALLAFLIEVSHTITGTGFKLILSLFKHIFHYYCRVVHTVSLFCQILEKGPSWVQSPVLNIVYCLLHYTDITGYALAPDLLAVIAKYMEGVHWKESLRILKLAVTGSSSLVLPPSSLRSSFPTASPTRSGDTLDSTALLYTKKELPGRTMEFTFDVTQTPIIGRRFLLQTQASSSASASASAAFTTTERSGLTVPDGVGAGITGISRITAGIGDISGLSQVSPRRSSFSPYDVANSSQGAGGSVPWKRPWQSQVRHRMYTT